MPKPYKDKKRRMTKICINELSAVDKPAQTPATAIIMKRANFDKGAITDLVMEEITASDLSYEVEIFGNDVYLTARDKQGQCFSLHKDFQGHYFISASENTMRVNDIDEDALNAVITEAINNAAAMISKTAPKEAKVFGKKQDFINAASCGHTAMEDNMSDNKTGATVEALTKQVQDLEIQLATASAMAAMSDIEKSHYATLDDSSKAEFVKMDSGARATAIEKAADANPVVYTSNDGTQFMKSDSPSIVAMAKRADALEDKLKKSEEEREAQAFAKRAETELDNMPGTVEVRAALIKAVDGIENEDVRSDVFKCITAKNAEMGSAFKTVGRGFVKGFDDETQSAEQELEALAKKHAADKGVSYLEAYDAVASANPELFTKAVGSTA